MCHKVSLGSSGSNQDDSAEAQIGKVVELTTGGGSAIEIGLETHGKVMQTIPQVYTARESEECTTTFLQTSRPKSNTVLSRRSTAQKLLNRK